ncbi:MAG: zinc-ribbon domain-containing protein [Xanthobacteraceae bacterium]
MLIVCPSCTRSYNVDPASLQPDGRMVRCAGCRIVWRAEPSQNREQPALDPPTEVHRAAQTIAAAGIVPDIDETQPVAEAESQGGWLEPSLAEAAAGLSVETRAEAVIAEHDGETASTGDVHNEASEVVAAEAPPPAGLAQDVGGPAIGVEVYRNADESRALPVDIERAAARHTRLPAKRRRSPLWPLSHLQSAIVGLLVVDAILIGWRKDIVRFLPQTAALYAAAGLPVNLRGVTFDSLSTSADANGGVPILVVQGNIVNATAAIATLPRLKLIIRNAAKQEIYSWTTAPPRAQLSPFEAVGFRTRLASPPPGAHDVLVRFVTRGDRLAEAP